jgi:hypothetical protein
VRVASGFQDDHQELLQQTPEELDSAEEAVALLPELEAALEAIGALPEGAQELLAEDRALLEDLKEKAEELTAPPPPPVQHTITFDSHGGSEVSSISANTGTEVKKPADPTKTGGYRFLGWFNAASGGTEYSAWDHTLTADITMHAQWRPELSIGVTITDHDGKLLDLGKEITISKTGNGHDTGFTAGVNHESYTVQWYLNGDPIDGSRGKALSIRINAQDYPKGNYYLGISVTRDGVYYSTDIYFTVTD